MCDLGITKEEPIHSGANPRKVQPIEEETHWVPVMSSEWLEQGLSEVGLPGLSAYINQGE